jgi:hypothetical protein
MAVRACTTLLLPTLLLPVLLAGCLAHYPPPAQGPTARVQVARKATPTICVDERQARLVPDADGYARVPALRAITLTAQFEGHDFVCIPAVSFTPEAEASYRQDFQVRSRTCTTSILRLEGGREVPVATSAPGSYGCLGQP